jgi:hypothetical protein
LQPFQDSNNGELQNRHIDEVQSTPRISLHWQGKLYQVESRPDTFAVSCETATARERAGLVRALCSRQREALKRKPYWPARRSTEIRLNCKADFPEKKDSKIECRHLVTQWIGMFLLSGNNKPDYAQLGTIEAIQKHVPRNAEQIHIASPRQGGPYVVSRADWGAQVAMQFESMLARKETASALETRTSGHAMAVGLKIKKVQGRCIYVVLFYDPNRTATHRRARFDDIADVEGLDPGTFDPVWGDIKEDALLMSPLTASDYKSLLKLTDMPIRAPSKLAGKLPALGSAAIRHLLDEGCIEALKELTPAFQRLPIAERYAALYTFPTPSSLYRVMLTGTAAMLAPFRELTEGMPDAARARVLLGLADTHMPGLQAAMLRGRIEMFQPYWLMVRDCLPAQWHVPLMRAAGTDGSDTLFFVCANGRAGVLEAYLLAIEDIGSSALALLLRARACNGRYGVVKAVVNGHTDLVRTFAGALCRLEPDDRAALLADVRAQFRDRLVAPLLSSPRALAALRELPIGPFGSPDGPPADGLIAQQPTA